MICEKCGGPMEEAARAICPACTSGQKSYVLTAGSATYNLTGAPIGTVVEGPPGQDERQVEYRPASGGRAVSRTDASGFEAELFGPLHRGKSGEGHVLKVLAHCLRAQGHDVCAVAGAQDDRGEDALLCIDGRTLIVQVMTIPKDEQLWKELASRESASRSGDRREAVAWIRLALEHKAKKATGTLLALDASHFGAMVGPHLVETYLNAYGNPMEEFPFSDIWILGPTERSSVRLGPAIQGR